MLTQEPDFNYLLEQVEMIEEMPISPGPSWDEHENPSLDEVQYMKKGTDAHIKTIIAAVKAFLNEHENSTFPGDYKQFRAKIAEIIKDTLGPDINRANAGYAARKIETFLKNNNVILVKAGDVKIASKSDIDSKLPPGEVAGPSTDDPVDEPAGEVDDVQPGVEPTFPKQRGAFKLGEKYVVDANAGDHQLSSDAAKLHNLLQGLNMTGKAIHGSEIVKAGRDYEMGYGAARQAAEELLGVGIIADPRSDSNDWDPADFLDAEFDADNESAFKPYIDRQSGPAISRQMDDWNA